jgi:ABC-type uncharacterized transport system substrate-binding protein
METMALKGKPRDMNKWREVLLDPIPIIFVVVADPIGAGFVASLPRPGGNITGFIFTEATMGGKRLELLTQIAPGVKRAANGGQAFSK